MAFWFGLSIIVYLVFMFALAIWANKQVHTTEDFLVAGRRLPLSMAWATLLATWFGAGTLLTATDEVAKHGLQKIALEPLGAGLCLIIAGLFYARKLWEMKLCTLSDFFERTFGPKAEVISAVVMCPGFFGWIAAQLVALAGILHLFFGIPISVGIIVIAVVCTVYTMIGGMLSVTLTDFVQIILILVGLVMLAFSAYSTFGGGSFAAGITKLMEQTDPQSLVVVPHETAAAFIGWISILLVGSLGNIPGQDLTQRIFSSRSGKTAKWACIIAGTMYIVFGMIPMSLGLLGKLMLRPDVTFPILPDLAQRMLPPYISVVFVLLVLSAVMSTIDSAILAPAGVIAQNILKKPVKGRISDMRLNHIGVVFVAGVSLCFAFMGDSAYELLASAYAVGLVGMFVPLTLGLHFGARNEKGAIASMVGGLSVFIIMKFIPGSENWLIPLELQATFCSLLFYLIVARLWPVMETSLPQPAPEVQPAV